MKKLTYSLLVSALLFVMCKPKSTEPDPQIQAEIEQMDSLSQELDQVKLELDEARKELEEALKAIEN